MFYKAHLFLIIFLTSKVFVYAQQSQNPLTMAIVCGDTNLKKKKSLTFIIEFINNDTNTVILPNRIISGPLRNIAVNLGFEILRIYTGDTIDVLATHNIDINALNSPFKNEFKLEPGTNRLVKVEVESFFFDEKGIYMIRFGLKKKNIIEKNLKFKNDIFSNWKIMNNK